MPTGSVKLTFGEKWKMQTKLAAQFAVGMMAKKAKDYCQLMLSADDHSQKDLDRLGNPYGRDSGFRFTKKGKQIGRARGPIPDDPPEMVHIQRGVLIAGLTYTKPVGTKDGVQAKVYNREKELDGWIQRGTRKMVARRYMDYVRTHYANEIVTAGRDEMTKRLQKEGRKSA